MGQRHFSWKDPQFTFADALTGARVVMLPYLLYALVARLAGMAVVTLGIMIVTDLVDGRVARRMKQSREFGAVLDSTIDFAAIYSLFTVLFATGVITWWKWAVIMLSGLLIAVTQLMHLIKASEVSFAPVRFGKLVGQIQFLYLPLLLARAFWLTTPVWQTVDHVVFGLLAVAIILNTFDYAGILIRLAREIR